MQTNPAPSLEKARFVRARQRIQGRLCENLAKRIFFCRKSAVFIRQRIERMAHVQTKHGCAVCVSYIAKYVTSFRRVG